MTTSSPINLRPFPADRGLRAGDAVGDDPATLAHYHAMADDLLKALAQRVEPTWDLAETALAEIDRLTALQAALVARLAARPACSPGDVMLKLSLWAAAHAGVDPRDRLPEDRLVESALRDLERLFGEGTQARA